MFTGGSLRTSPAVGGGLNRAEEHHGRGDVEPDQQHAEQDQPASHAEDARQERRGQDGDGDDAERNRTHQLTPLMIIALFFSIDVVLGAFLDLGSPLS